MPWGLRVATRVSTIIWIFCLDITLLIRENRVILLVVRVASLGEIATSVQTQIPLPDLGVLCLQDYLLLNLI